MRFLASLIMGAVLFFSCSLNVDKNEKLLYHAVCLDVLDELPEGKGLDYLINELQKLTNVETANSVVVGQKAETGDPRLDSNYDLTLLVTFTSLENLKSYSTNPLHLRVRENIKDLLAGPPVVYDWWDE